jgi:hypothetical protein
VTTANNALLYNAALAGAVAGIVRGRYLTARNSGTPPLIGTPDPSFEDIADQVVDWAPALDALIPTDDAASPQPPATEAISIVSTGQAIIPTTGAIQTGQLGKARLMEMLALAVFESRYYPQPVPVTELQFDQLADIVSDSYLSQENGIGLASVSVSSAAHNTVVSMGAFNGAAGAILLLNQGGLPPDQTLLLTAAVAIFATAFDALVPNDSTISNGTGGTLAPASPLIQTIQFGANRLALSIALGVIEQRSTFSLTQFGTGTAINETAIDDWALVVAPPTAACYNACLGGLVTGGGSAPPFNPLLYNEAYCGFIAGILAGRPITASSDTNAFYVALGAAATAFATAVDEAVGESDTVTTPVPTGTQPITSSNIEGVINTIQPSTSPIQEGEVAKTGVMWAICRAVTHSRTLLGTIADTTVTTYEAQADSIVALYLVLAEDLFTP